MRGMLITSFAALGLLSATAVSAQIPTGGDMSAYMPSKAEMRKGLVEAGMTPAQIEQILSSMDFPEATVAAGTRVANAEPACEDANENDICDSEEADPDITQCRAIYQNAIYNAAQNLSGGTLGRNAVEVAQTCSMAAAGGTMYYGKPIGETGPGGRLGITT
ncbi:hypothetical protein AB8615_03965 [Litorimonas sp. RW-G-Af-16]|uniref:hypothetical protein n=1 Tax=Litorimonas sp. RW-G-Af-16 TaxID=3241168 RepID=UPI003AAA2DBD